MQLQNIQERICFSLLFAFYNLSTPATLKVSMRVKTEGTWSINLHPENSDQVHTHITRFRPSLNQLSHHESTLFMNPELPKLSPSMQCTTLIRNTSSWINCTTLNRISIVKEYESIFWHSFATSNSSGRFKNLCMCFS